MSKSEDDFWNTSSSSAFNFDEDDDTSKVFEDTGLSSISPESSTLPIHVVISGKCLGLVLDDVRSTNEHPLPPIEDVIKKLFAGQKISLQLYRKFCDKMSLLDHAVKSRDGNIILQVILFLKSTLKTNIFFNQLAKRKSALKHYGYYLMINKEYQQLIDLYMATGNAHHTKELYYLMGSGISNRDMLLKKLEQFSAEHLQKLKSKDDRLQTTQYIQFSQYQVSNKQNANSVIHCLTILCKDELSKNKNTDKILEFKKCFKIDDMAYEWTMMNVLATLKHWTQLCEMFIKMNWLTKKNSLKTCFKPEVFIYGLSRHDPPKDVLVQFLNYISDSETSLNLAKKLHCHNFVIQQLFNRRDRLGLISYKSKVGVQSQEFFAIEHALKATDRKWKN